MYDHGVVGKVYTVYILRVLGFLSGFTLKSLPLTIAIAKKKRYLEAWHAYYALNRDVNSFL